ncbi:hypothetical protein SlGVgp135 [Spodoptera litura granulovirus]|uniref:Uncharacterized protein n=1 Tax=Spodoptera litura granulovirus TaxID=359919 RepID=A5IZY7_9BBAC|nr:hypothetical protein SlGVgp135 [Spodoptera litura granulovirus]ABQ52078.1 hypothetical protein SlGVgp135 [Spodoptera litura granulovirus]
MKQQLILKHLRDIHVVSAPCDVEFVSVRSCVNSEKDNSLILGVIKRMLEDKLNLLLDNGALQRLAASVISERFYSVDAILDKVLTFAQNELSKRGSSRSLR